MYNMNFITLSQLGLLGRRQDGDVLERDAEERIDVVESAA